MARLREFEPEQALEQAMLLFWQKGYADTSVDDLVEATGVSRYGLYGTFGDKRKLFTQALQHYVKKMHTERLQGLTRPDASLGAILDLFRMLKASVSTPEGRLGCLLCNTATEMGWTDAEMGQMVREFFAGEVELFTRALTNAQAKGEIDPDADPAALARNLATAKMGMAVLVRSRMTMDQLEPVARAALMALRPTDPQALAAAMAD